MSIPMSIHPLQIKLLNTSYSWITTSSTRVEENATGDKSAHLRFKIWHIFSVNDLFRLPIILDDIQTRKINICCTVPTYHKDLGPGFWGGKKKSSEDAINWKEEDEQHGQTKNKLKNLLWKKSLKTAHCRTLNTTNMSGCWSKQYNGLQALNESTGIEADENFLYILYHTIWAHNDSQNFNTSILVFSIYETGKLVFHDKWLL